MSMTGEEWKDGVEKQEFSAGNDAICNNVITFLAELMDIFMFRNAKICDHPKELALYKDLLTMVSG